ncbi:MAG: FAD/NAD(P)-binding protein, partial [Caldilineaceae bacterium]|nr:FAD/NAD(P)-binding protein [Caldilineaceae bacterium]
MIKLAIVGSGPMALYSLKYLQESANPLTIEIFEATDQAGTGMPYRADMNADYMLCNAFSREIPAVTQTLINWLTT